MKAKLTFLLFFTSSACMQNTLSQHVTINDSYKATNLNCDTFTIGSSCVISGLVDARSGTVGSSMKAPTIEIQKELKVGSCLKADSLKCYSFNVGSKCVAGTIKAVSGEVGYKMKANIINVDFLHVGNYLHAYILLTTNNFSVGNKCVIDGPVNADSGKVGRSMEANIVNVGCLDVGSDLNIKNGGTINKLSVGDLLTCSNLVVNGPTKVGDRIDAVGCLFNHIFINNRKEALNIEVKNNSIEVTGKSRIVSGSCTVLNTGNGVVKFFNCSPFSKVTITNNGNNVRVVQTSTVNIASNGNNVSTVQTAFSIVGYLYSYVWHLYKKFVSVFLYRSISPQTITFQKDNFLLEEEISTFKNCTVESLDVDKNNGKKQIVVLENTTFNGDITFSQHTKGEVRLCGTTNFYGKVTNGECTDMRNQNADFDKSYHIIMGNASAPLL